VREIRADIVIPTPLAFYQPKPASRVVIGRGRAAQVDQRSQILLVLERCGGYSVPLEGYRDAPVEVRRCEFDRVGRHYPGIQAIEPT